MTEPVLKPAGLYSNYHPIGIRAGWEQCSMGVEGSGHVLRRHGVPADFGDPTEAVAWFDGEALKVLVADFPNGRRVTLRKRQRDCRIEYARRP